MGALTAMTWIAFLAVCFGVGFWLGGSREIHRLQSRRFFARRNVRRGLAVAPVRWELLLSHAAKFCSAEPRNATQSFCGGLRT